MTMQTDILAGKNLTTSEVLQDQNGNTVGRCRIKAVLLNTNSGSVTLSIYYGSSATGTYFYQLTATGSTTNYQLLPGEGILCPNGAYVTISGIGNYVIFYG